MSAAFTFPSTWIFYSPKSDIVRFSFSSLCVIESATRRRITTQRLLLSKCSSSLNEESPVAPSAAEPKEEEEEKKKLRPDRDLDLSFAIPLEAVKRRRPKGSPILLWKRIFFASKKVRSIIMLNILAVIYASNIPVLKEVEQIVDPALFTVVRFTVTAIPFLPFLFHAREDCQTRSAGIELGFWVSLGYLFQAIGLLTSGAGQASFISAFTVVVVPLIDGILGATVPTLTWSGALVSLIGVGLLESGGSPHCVGDIFNFMSTVFFGVHILRTEQISRSTKKEKFLALLGYQTSVVALSSAVWFMYSDMFSEVHLLNFSGSLEWSAFGDWITSFPWIPAIYAGVFSTGLCLWAELGAMRDVSATETAIVYGMEPVWGAAFAWFLLGERWDTTEWFGAALVICGSLTVQILGSNLEEPSEKNSSKNYSQTTPAADDQKEFSLSSVVVKSGKNIGDHLRKK